MVAINEYNSLFVIIQPSWKTKPVLIAEGLTLVSKSKCKQKLMKIGEKTVTIGSLSVYFFFKNEHKSRNICNQSMDVK